MNMYNLQKLLKELLILLKKKIMGDDIVSVGIPMYNAEKFIKYEVVPENIIDICNA